MFLQVLYVVTTKLPENPLPCKMFDHVVQHNVPEKLGSRGCPGKFKEVFLRVYVQNAFRCEQVQLS